MSPYWWLAIAAVMAILEAVSQVLVTIWFVVGGLAAFVAGYFGASLAVQVVVFLVTSLVCLVLLRPFILRHRKMGELSEPTPVGLYARVVERIDPVAQTGRVEMADHMTWAALPDDEEPIEVGTRVQVVEQRSIKLVVRRLDEPAQV